MNQTAKRKQQFCEQFLDGIDRPIGFVDVGSGGPLKYPWDTLPARHIRKFDFEPTDAGGDVPLCVSNHEGPAKFYVAEDERASSLHEPLREFAERFGQQSIYTKKTLDVRCTTLDRHFAGEYGNIDLLDVNVEGHDFQALQGAEALLKGGAVKLIKVEFELTAVWKGQGWFSDIDAYLRAAGFDLADIEIEYARPVKARHIFHRGEPLWGKGMYVLNAERWGERVRAGDTKALADDLRRAVALYVITDLPGRALDIVGLGAAVRAFDRAQAIEESIAAVYEKARQDAVSDEVKKVGRFFSNMMKR